MSLKEFPSLGDQVPFQGWEGHLEEGMATHSRILAWRVPWAEGLSGYSPWGHKVSDTPEQLPLSLSSLGTGAC